MTSENYTVIAIIVSLIFYAMYKGSKEEKKHFENNANREKLRLKEIEERKEKNIDKIRSSLRAFAVENNKVYTTLYDLEEGGHYLREINEEDITHLNLIIEQEYSKLDVIQSKYFELDRINLKKGYDRILNEMPKSGSNRSVGF